eukprot:5045563-Amphidinium_carterae.1
MVAEDEEVCDLTEPALGKHSPEAILCNIKAAHGQHRSQASIGERSRETVLVDVEPCDLRGNFDKTTAWELSHDAVDI